MHITYELPLLFVYRAAAVKAKKEEEEARARKKALEETRLRHFRLFIAIDKHLCMFASICQVVAGICSCERTTPL